MNEVKTLVRTDDLSIGFTKRAESPVIEGLSISVHENELFVITGPTGSSKSTLLRVLSAQNTRKGPKILGGDVTVLGRDLSFLVPRARYRLQAQIGYLSQDAAMQLSAQFTAAENIVLPITSRDKHWDKTDLSKRVYALLDELELPKALASKYPHELSSGQRQRVALAQSVILDPVLWLADDPTRGVDVIARRAVLEFIRRRKETLGITMIIATADQTIVREYADRIAVLDEGKLADLGTVENLLNDPQSFYLRDYFEIAQ